MQPYIVSLIALFAPLPAVAFGDLDCIALKSCTNDTCSPITDLTSNGSLSLFSVTFDWTAQQALVTSGGGTSALPLIQRPLSTVLEGDAPILQTTAVFGDDTLGHLRIQGQDSASGHSLIAFWTLNSPPSTILRATCETRKAA